jgi:hypothetical protein
MKSIIKFAAGIAALLASSCVQPNSGGSPFEMNPEIPFKRLMTNSAPVKAICYVDAERDNPLNAKDYVFAASAEAPETQFFNYVVLGYGYLTKSQDGYTHLELTPALKRILDSSITYIKPLHQRGIQVLIEVRSGIFSDADDGAGVGLGTMDMAAVNELIKELKRLVEHYGIDGFDFNDTGGGKKSYPPLTRELKRFQSEIPLYPDSLFADEAGNSFSSAEIEAELWIEGGSNFSNLIQRLNEELKQVYTRVSINGNLETVETQTVERSIFVRDRNHGRHLLSQLRMAYMPDAYSGADPKVPGNLRYIVHDVPYDDTRLHASLWDEAQNRDTGAEADEQYAPFAVDLLDQKDAADARRWANVFLLKNPDGSSSDAGNQNRYGALFVTNLRPASEVNSAVYLTYFSRVLFGRTTMLVNQPGAGDYR